MIGTTAPGTSIELRPMVRHIIAMCSPFTVAMSLSLAHIFDAHPPNRVIAKISVNSCHWVPS